MQLTNKGTPTGRCGDTFEELMCLLSMLRWQCDGGSVALRLTTDPDSLGLRSCSNQRTTPTAIREADPV
jgi:hypothetical protein